MLSDKYSIQLRSDQKIWWLLSISTLQPWWNLVSAGTDEPFQHLSFHNRWWKINDDWRNLTVARIILQALPFNWQPLTARLCKVSSTIYGYRSYINHRHLFIAMVFEMSDKSHLWYPAKPSLLFLRPDTLFLTPWNICPRCCSNLLQHSHHDMRRFSFFHFSGPQTSIEFSAAMPFTSSSSMRSCLVSTLIGQRQLFILSTLSCVSRLTSGQRSTSSWLPDIVCLSPCALISQLTPHWLFFLFLLWIIHMSSSFYGRCKYLYYVFYCVWSGCSQND